MLGPTFTYVMLTLGLIGLFYLFYKADEMLGIDVLIKAIVVMLLITLAILNLKASESINNRPVIERGI